MYRIAVEELAFAMGFLGDSAAAAGFLNTIFGEQNQDNLSGRITAASHSLLARDLLTIDLGSGESRLTDEFHDIVQTIVTSGRSVRCQRLVEGQDQVLTFFFSDGRIVSHEIEMGVVSRLAPIDHVDEVSVQVVAFLEPVSVGQPIMEPLGRLSTDALQRIRQAAAIGDSQQINAELEGKISPSVVADLLEDLSDPKIVWGSILRLETVSGDSETAVTSDNAILSASVIDRRWLFLIRDSDPVNAEVYVGGETQLLALVDFLLSGMQG